jgi:hypothetical protein
LERARSVLALAQARCHPLGERDRALLRAVREGQQPQRERREQRAEQEREPVGEALGRGAQRVLGRVAQRPVTARDVEVRDLQAVRLVVAVDLRAVPARVAHQYAVADLERRQVGAAEVVEVDVAPAHVVGHAGEQVGRQEGHVGGAERLAAPAHAEQERHALVRAAADEQLYGRRRLRAADRE